MQSFASSNNSQWESMAVVVVSDGVVAVVVEVGHGGQSVGVVVLEEVVLVVVEVGFGFGGKLRLTRDLPKESPCFTCKKAKTVIFQ